MFKSASFRLTLWYLAILMMVSLMFSLALYATSAHEVDRGLRRSPYPTYDFLQPFTQNSGFDNYREQRVTSIQQQLAIDLIIFNLIVLALGGAASYLLARRTLEPIEEAMEAQSRFTADASHELRTPLTSMRSEIEVALRGKRLNESAARELLSSNLEEVLKLEALSNGLLRLAQFSSGKPPAWQPVQVTEVIKAATDRLAKDAELKQSTITTNVAYATIEGDQTSLTELVVVLVDNAIKYGAGKPVSITGAIKSHHLILRIVDEGIGIKASDLPHIFERFYRADTSRSKTTVDGYGLGLSIAKQIVDLHNGRISVDSTGSGTTFTVSLPIHQSKKSSLL